MSNPESPNEVDFPISDFEGSELSSLEGIEDIQPQSLVEKMLDQSLDGSFPNGSQPDDMVAPVTKDELGLFSDTSSLTDIVSNWGSDKDTFEKSSIELILDLDRPVSRKVEKQVNGFTNPNDRDSAISSLASEETTNTKRKGPTTRIKRLNLQSKLNLDRPNDMDRAGRTQLFRYAERGDYESCRKLLLARADVNIVDNAGWSPLHLACARGASQIVQLFIDHHADIHTLGFKRQTALHDAALSGSLETVKILIEAGADINARNLDGQSPIDICNQTDCLGYLNQHFETKNFINQHNHDGQSRLHLACLDSDLKSVTKLLDDGADVNVLNSEKSTPLHIASQLGATEIIAALIHRGALVNVQDFTGFTPLHYASESNHVMAVKLLLEHRSDPLISNHRNQMPLDLSNDEIVKSLIRDHIIQYSCRAMDMDMLLPRNNKLSSIESPITDQFRSLPGTPVDENWNHYSKINGLVNKPQKIELKRPQKNSSKSSDNPSLKTSPTKEHHNEISTAFPLVKSSFRPSHKSAPNSLTLPDIDVNPDVTPSPALSSFSPLRRQRRNKLPMSYGHSLENYLNGSLNDSQSPKKLAYNHARQEPKFSTSSKELLNLNSHMLNHSVTGEPESLLLPRFDTPALGPVSLSSELRCTIHEALGYTPIYCVLLPSIVDEGFLALDFQVQLFLRLTRTQTLLDKYPNIFRQKLTSQQKHLMWPLVEQMLKLNANPSKKIKRMDYKDFLRSNMHFIRWKDVVNIVWKDFKPLFPILENVAYDINYQSSVDSFAPSLPGDEGFPPSESSLQPSSNAHHNTDINISSSHRTIYPNLDYIGPPDYVRKLTKFLQNHPELNPRPDLPITDSIRLFIAQKKFRPA